MQRKVAPIGEVKAEGEGRFSALAAVWEVVDRVGDRMMPGSFSETLRRWRESGKRIPIVWSHKTDSPDSIIGSADANDVRETSSGLQVDGELDIEESSAARRAWQLLRSGASSGWSFGYITKKQKRGSDGVNELFEVELLELGPTVSPANPATATLAVKEVEEGVLVGKAWDGSASNYTDEEYAAACVLDRNDCGDAAEMPAKQRYSLPVAPPGSTWLEAPDRDGVAAATQRLSQVDAGPKCKKFAARRLVRAYAKLEVDPPSTLVVAAKTDLELQAYLDEMVGKQKAARPPIRVATFTIE